MSEDEWNFSFKRLFIPLTAVKAIYIIVSLGFIAYFNALFGAFVWDDFGQVRENYFIHSLSNFPKLFTGSTFGAGTVLFGRYYRPLMTLSYSIIWSLFGPRPFFFHLTQIMLHIINSILLFVLFRKFFTQQPAFFLSLIFLVHPINVEAIAYISALQEPLFFLFGISAFLLSLKEHISTKRTIAIGLLLLCSLLSKETGILFIFILLVYRSIFRYRKHLIRIILSVLTPTLIYTYLRFFVAKLFFQRGEQVPPIMAAPITERVFTMPAILFFYLKTFFFPKDLTVDQKWLITHQGIQFYLPLFIDTVFLIGIILFGVWIYRTRKVHFSLFLFFTLWFLVGIGFHMQLLPLDMTVADRWFYFPMVGLLGIIGVGLNTTLLRTDKVKSTVIIACFLLIGILTMRTIARNTIWYNEITFRSNGAQEGDAIPMYDDYLNEEKQGLELMDKGMMEQAVPHF
ncbi:MAG TPA: hypothetical protein VEP90_02175, partial [Methylomirabilota bacterium]|nr:hypothetical protein [Methylomirabilota bacterium]